MMWNVKYGFKFIYSSFKNLSLFILVCNSLYRFEHTNSLNVYDTSAITLIIIIDLCKTVVALLTVA